MKKTMFPLFLTTIAFVSQVCLAQDQAVSLRTVVGSRAVQPRLHPTSLYGPESFNFDPARKFKGVPPELSRTLIKELDFQPEQGMYELYKRLSGKMPSEMLVKELARYHADTLALSSSPIKHSVHILCGMTDKGKRVIITDANNNLDFSDDTPQTYDTAGLGLNVKGAEDRVANQTVAYQFARGGKVYDRKINLRMSPYQTAFRYNNAAEQEQYLIAFVNEFRQGSVTLDGKEYTVTLFTAYQPPFTYDPLNTEIFITEAAGGNTAAGAGRSPAYSLGDTLAGNGNKYSLAAIDPEGSELLLRYAGKGEAFLGFDSGRFAYPISCRDMSGKPFDLYALKGRYVLLDFWGSWCKPCISAIPELLSLHQQYKDSLSIVSIAFDETGNLGKLKEIIAGNKMEWTHLFEDMKDKDTYSIVKRFKITAFPTQILIAPDGKIIRRLEGAGKGSLVADAL
jgi:thiol-disulfide isomerase/thioredoxin